MSDQPSKEQIAAPEQRRPVVYTVRQRLFGLPIAYSGVLFFCALAGFANGENWFLTVVALAWIAATIQLTAMWAALGRGPYLNRSIYSFLAGICVACGGVAGMLLSGVFSDPGEVFSVIAVGIACGPMLWFINQVPFFLQRSIFGWQFANKKKPNLEPATISDIMSITTIAAVAFASLQAVHILNQDSIGTETIWAPIATSAVMLFIVCFVLSMPAILFVFFSRESSSGCTKYLLYILGMVVLIVVVLVALSSGRVPPMFVAVLLVFFGAYALAFCLPLMFLADGGIVLWTKPRIRAWVLKQQRETDSVKEDPNGVPSKDDTAAASESHPLD